MARDLKATLVSRLDRRAQFLARDMSVGLERSHTAIRPKIQGLTRILRPSQLRHLKVSAGSIEIGPGHVQMWARKRAALNSPLEFQIRIGLHAARRAHGRNAVGKKKARRRETHLQK